MRASSTPQHLPQQGGQAAIPATFPEPDSGTDEVECRAARGLARRCWPSCLPQAPSLRRWPLAFSIYDARGAHDERRQWPNTFEASVAAGARTPRSGQLGHGRDTAAPSHPARCPIHRIAPQGPAQLAELVADRRTGTIQRQIAKISAECWSRVVPAQAIVAGRRSGHDQRLSGESRDPWRSAWRPIPAGVGAFEAVKTSCGFFAGRRLMKTHRLAAPDQARQPDLARKVEGLGNNLAGTTRLIRQAAGHRFRYLGGVEIITVVDGAVGSMVGVEKRPCCGASEGRG